MFTALATIDYTSSASSPAFGIVGAVIGIILLVAFWRVFTKAGQPGWAILVPIFNAYVLTKIVGRPGWWVVLLFIPIVNIVITIIIMLDLAQAFGRSAVFGVLGLILFPYVGALILGFGSDTYRGTARNVLA